MVSGLAGSRRAEPQKGAATYAVRCCRQRCRDGVARAERFDMAVLEAYEPIEQRWQGRVSELDVAVDEIPRIAARNPENIQWPPEVIADGPIALARLIPAGVDVRSNATRARIVLFRKPIERRAQDTVELGELLHDLLVAQVATYLDVDPSVIDPTIDD